MSALRPAMRLRLPLSFAVTLAMPLAGCYLAGWLALRLLHLDAGLLRWDTYPHYLAALHLPQVAPYAVRIKLAGLLGFVAALLPGGALLVLLLRQPARALHGDARFAGMRELARKGLFDDAGDGIVAGRCGRRIVRLRGQQSVILAAPTRSGKGVGVVVPNLLDYRESIVVLDIKQENFAITSGWRAAQGQAVFLFNPFAEDRRSHRWNPLSYVSNDSAFRVSDLMGLAATLYPEAGDEQKFWVSHARNAFMAFALYLFDCHAQELAWGFPGTTLPTLGAIFRLAAGEGGELRPRLRVLSEAPFLCAQGRAAFAGLLAHADETLASVLGTFREPLNPWLNPVLDAATSGDDFRFTDLRRTPTTIYVGIQPGKLAESRLLLNLFFSQLIDQNTRQLPQADPTLRHQCLLLMDEFTAVGKLDVLAASIAYMAGYNLRLLPIIQSVAQLDATYGKEVARTLLTNHAMQVLFAPREQRDANDYSEMLGYTTVRRHNVTRGREVSRSEVHERRALMLPQELRALGEEREVLLYEGIAHPVLCDKIRYWRDRRYAARVLPAVPVPTLQL